MQCAEVVSKWMLLDTSNRWVKYPLRAFSVHSLGKTQFLVSRCGLSKCLDDIFLNSSRKAPTAVCSEHHFIVDKPQGLACWFDCPCMGHGLAGRSASWGSCCFAAQLGSFTHLETCVITVLDPLMWLALCTGWSSCAQTQTALICRNPLFIKFSLYSLAPDVLRQKHLSLESSLFHRASSENGNSVL